jgi:hypothetical protein
MHDLPPQPPRIPARPLPLIKRLIYHIMVRSDAWAHFDRVRARVVGNVPHPADGPLIAYMNHPGWWDGYMAFFLDQEVLPAGFTSYIMMEERQLRDFRFFSYCGAFSINRTIPGDSERTITWISDRMRRRPDSLLWILPQGRIVPNDRRPLTIYPGIARVAQQVGNALLWPVALRYEFLGEQRPEAFIRAGPAHALPVGASETQALELIRARLTDSVDALRSDVAAEQFAEYRTLLRGLPGINRLSAGLFRLRR